MAQEEFITTRRLESLTDGIFAFSMTLLVLFIETPKANHLHSPEQLQGYLTTQYPQFISYLVTFLVIANFWIIHHNISRFIIKTNATNIWLNMLFMLFIVLLPFSSVILGDYSTSWGTIFLFISNLFCICSILLIIWLYASYKHRLITKEITKERIHIITRNLSIGVVISLASIVLSFVDLSLALYVYLLIPASIFILGIFKKS